MEQSLFHTILELSLETTLHAVSEGQLETQLSLVISLPQSP